MQRQREEWKEDGGIEKNGNWESEGVSDIEEPIHAKMHAGTFMIDLHTKFHMFSSNS
jgi:hypothetical protein